MTFGFKEANHGFRLNEEQQMLQDTVARLRAVNTVLKKSAWHTVKPEAGFSVDFWKQLSESGINIGPIF
jgi:hypothetical protein